MAEPDQSAEDGPQLHRAATGARSPDKLTLAPDLIQARERLGLTQAQLAAQSGLSLAAIKGYETGRTLPGARELRQLCQVLQITPNKLIFGEEAPFGSVGGAEVFAGPFAATVHRHRITGLLQHLTSDESASFYSLMSALVLARHGRDVLQTAEEWGDMAAGVEVINQGGPFVSDLFRFVTRDRRVALEFAQALRKAAGISEEGPPDDL